VNYVLNCVLLSTVAKSP